MGKSEVMWWMMENVRSVREVADMDRRLEMEAVIVTNATKFFVVCFFTWQRSLFDWLNCDGQIKITLNVRTQGAPSTQRR